MFLDRDSLPPRSEDGFETPAELLGLLWLETWHEGVEEASRLYFGEGNVSGMLELLPPLHEILEKGAETRHASPFDCATNGLRPPPLPAGDKRRTLSGHQVASITLK
jgi:hypothetical protein